MKEILVAGLVSVLASFSAVAQQAPVPGPSGGNVEMWLANLPAGTWVVIGGALFIWTGESLISSDDIPDPDITPTPTPTPPTTTTTTT